MDKDKKLAKESVRALPFGKKIKHYLYYYKLHIIVAAAVVAMAGLYLYQNFTAVSPSVEISVFSNEYITVEAEEAAEEALSELMQEQDEEEFVAVLNITTMPSASAENSEQLSAAYTKLDGQLAAKTVSAFIFDEETYENIMSVNDYSSIVLSEYSGELSSRAKEFLKLNSDTKYYYVTRILYPSEQDDEEAVKKFENAKTVFKKLKDMD